ncbi:MAG: DUF3987 domain-containing protein [Trichlorobacter sp.]|nr:DUF3987 domain-containing protein [Trichlorobacter sp.]
MDSDLQAAAENACAEIGVIFRQVPTDGGFHQLDVEGKSPRNGAGRIRMFPDGEGGQVWNHVTDNTRLFWAKSDQSLTPAEAEERRHRAKEEREKAEQRLTEARQKAATLAVEIWKAATPPVDSLYWQRKQVEPTDTIREIPLDTLVKLISYHPKAKGKPFTGDHVQIIPVRGDKGISTIEMIDATGLKADLADGQKKGCFWATGRLPVGDSTTVVFIIGEGAATVLSGVKAMPGSIGIAALSCGNLKSVAEKTRSKYPQSKIIILADIGNGEQAAVEAARFTKAFLVKPSLPAGSTGSDINDVHCELGIDEVRRQIEAATTVEELQPEPDVEEGEALPIEQRRFAVRPFPFGILPEPFSRLVTEYATALQVQPEIITMQMMTVTSGTIGNSIVLQIKRGWETPPFLWTAIIGDTGSGKSHSGEAIIQPVKEQQAREATCHKKLMEEYQLELAAYKADKKHNTTPKEPPPMLHFYTTNFTIEALIPMYQANARGLIIHVDELAGLFRGLNQYKASGNDQEQLLSLFNATDIKADRKSGSGYVRNSGAAVMGGIQNGILSQVFGESDYINGMAYRVLPVVMDAMPPRFTLDSISKNATDTWRSFIDWTYQIPLEIDPESDRIKPIKLTLEPAALEAWRLFHDRFAEAEPFVSSKFRGYLPKLRTYCLKFMTILHVMECYRHDTLATVVSVDTVTNSILLTEYFAGQALQLIRGATTERNPYHATLHKALDSLQGDVTGGRLLLSSIRDRMNEMLPVDMRIETTQNKRLATWLKEIGLTVTKRADNKSVVLLS